MNRMLQTFDARTAPDQGPPRLAALRTELAGRGLDGFLVPRADAHQGEFVAARDERLAWLTGFTGSAGFCVVLMDSACLFVDGRYRIQASIQTSDDFGTLNLPEAKPGDWLAERLPEGGNVGFDPMLHTAHEIETLRKRLVETPVKLLETDNPIDRIWHGQPDPPTEPAYGHPLELSGEGSVSKRDRIAEGLRKAGHRAAVLTLPDSICWLLNVRGGDIPRTPVTLAFAIFHDDGRTQLFSDPGKFADLGPDPAITVTPWDGFRAALAALEGPVLLDRSSVPFAVTQILDANGIGYVLGQDPCILPKARKNVTEIEGSRAAHLRDAAAMCRFLAWLDMEAVPGEITEIDVVRRLERFRVSTGALRDISFETICASGDHGAIVHYRVTEETNRAVQPGDLLLVDSGGQYPDGTTDLTRTLAIGSPTAVQRQCFTRVLQGMICISTVRWPRGLAGRDLDPLARTQLWRAGLDYDHGTGHGVGSYLGVHEGPQRLARTSDVPLEPGMIVSNEPGYYREGEFGIRIENLVTVRDAPELEGGDGRRMLEFETLTLVPIDRRLIDAELLTRHERDWLNGYHRNVRDRVSGSLDGQARDWLEGATRPV